MSYPAMLQAEVCSRAFCHFTE